MTLQPGTDLPQTRGLPWLDPPIGHRTDVEEKIAVPARAPHEGSHAFLQ